jgi:hypothetical protein
MPSHPPYSSLLLNELHEYFPDILYRPGRFQNVSDLVNYIGEVARQSPYERLRAEYERDHPLQTANAVPQTANAVPQPANLIPQTANNIPHLVRIPSPLPSSPPLLRSIAQTSPLREDTRFTTDVLQSLLYGTPPSRSSLNRVSDSLSIPINITSSLLSSRPVRMPVRINTASDQQMVNQMFNNFINELTLPSPQMDLSSLESFLNESVIVHPSEEEINRSTILNCYNPEPYDNCAICQDAMEEGQTVRIIRYCSHKFHQECIDTWFQSHVTCPTCRHDIRGAIEQ